MIRNWGINPVNHVTPVDNPCSAGALHKLIHEHAAVDFDRFAGEIT